MPVHRTGHSQVGPTSTSASHRRLLTPSPMGVIVSDEHTSGNRWEPGSGQSGEPGRPNPQPNPQSNPQPQPEPDDTAPIFPAYAEPPRATSRVRRHLGSSAAKVAAAAGIILLAGGVGGFAAGQAASDDGSSNVVPGRQGQLGGPNGTSE